MMLLKKKIHAGDAVFHIVNTLVFTLFTFACIYPFYYVLINSISDNESVIRGSILFLPHKVHFNNYIEILHISELASALWVTVLRTILGTFVTISSTTILGYAMSRKEYWHRKFWYRFMIATMYFGAGLIPVYLNVKRLGLLDNFWVYILPAFISPYNMILVKTYIESIPQSLEEAAIMDGAGYAARFLKIIVPLSTPIIATIAIFTAVGNWNSFMDSVLYMTGSKYQTLQAVLQVFLNRADMLAQMMKKNPLMVESIDMSKIPNTTVIRNAMTIFTTVPIVLVYPFFQRYFAKGIMIGAVKG